MAAHDESGQRVLEATSLADLAVADHVWDVYAVLAARDEGTTSTKAPFLTLTLDDQSGSVKAKVWSDPKEAFEKAKAIPLHKAVKVRGRMKTWKDEAQLVIERIREVDPATDKSFDPAKLVDPALAHVEDLVCKTLVVDIETVPAQDFASLPDSVADALEQFAQRKEPAAGPDVLQARIGMAMGLSTLFGKVVSIALGDGDAPDGDVHVLAVPPSGFAAVDTPPWLRMLDEPDLLRAFWALASKAEVVVTFNGRSFDVPFLVGRSIVHGVPVRSEIATQKYGFRPHLDLFEFLSQRDKAPSKLDVICWAFGIESPKGDMDGSKVAPAYARGEIVKIAEYNRHDVRATAAVYRKLRDTVLRYRSDWK